MGRQVGTTVVGSKATVGRPHATGTVLARIMRERDIKVFRVSAALNVSHSTVYNLLKRRAHLSALQVVILSELMDMNAEELVQADGLLLADTQGR